jgi:hypothetical protein
VIDMAKLRVPLDWDPNGTVFLAVAAPDGIDGDAVFSYPALVKGDDGDPPTLDSDVNLTVLEYTDPAPDAASWTLVSPGTYQFNSTQRKGPKGDTGTNILHTAGDLAGTLTPGNTLIVNPTSDGFTVVGQKVGDWYTPATIADTASGANSFTVTTVPIPAQTYDWRPHCEGLTIVTGTGTNVITDYVARLNGTGTSGNELARCFGMVPTERLILAGGPPPGSPDGWDRVAAGVGANILFRVERQSGSDSFTTSHTTTRARVKVDPVP